MNSTSEDCRSLQHFNVCDQNICVLFIWKKGKEFKIFPFRNGSCIHFDDWLKIKIDAHLVLYVKAKLVYRLQSNIIVYFIQFLVIFCAILASFIWLVFRFEWASTINDYVVLSFKFECVIWFLATISRVVSEITFCFKTIYSMDKFEYINWFGGLKMSNGIVCFTWTRTNLPNMLCIGIDRIDQAQLVIINETWTTGCFIIRICSRPH